MRSFRSMVNGSWEFRADTHPSPGDTQRRSNVALDRFLHGGRVHELLRCEL